jgi:hypothetical protein
MLRYTTYRQGDPKWAATKIGVFPGGKTVTLGSHGCFITSFTNALANYAIDITPPQAVAKLLAVNGLTTDGQLTYDGIMRAFPDVAFWGRHDTTVNNQPNYSRMDIGVALKRIQKLVRLGQPVILCVDAINNDKIADHAVLCVSENFDVVDPAYGDLKPIAFRYGQPDRSIYGFVALIGSPVEFNDETYAPEGQALWKMTQAYKLAGNAAAKQYAKEAIDILLSY